MLFAKAFEQTLRETAGEMPMSSTSSSVPFPPAPRFVKVKKNGKVKVALKQPGPKEIRTFPKMN